MEAALRFRKLTLVTTGRRITYRDYFQGPWCCWHCSQRKSGSCEWFPVKSVFHVPVEEIENRQKVLLNLLTVNSIDSVVNAQLILEEPMGVLGEINYLIDRVPSLIKTL